MLPCSLLTSRTAGEATLASGREAGHREGHKLQDVPGGRARIPGVARTEKQTGPGEPGEGSRLWTHSGRANCCLS